MDILDSDDVRSPRRLRPSLPAAVLVALVLLGGAQAWASLRPQPLPARASVEALPNGYSYGTDGDRATIGFQLRNDGDAQLEVVDVRADVPGLQAVDVTVSGLPPDFRLNGEGPDPLQVFALPAGAVVEVTMVFRVRRCDEVPRDRRDVLVAVETGRAQGELLVPLPSEPAESVDADPDAQDPWQRVLVRDLCD